MGQLKVRPADILDARELELYQCYLLARQLTCNPPLESSIEVADHFNIDSSEVQDIVDRVREANGYPPLEW